MRTNVSINARTSVGIAAAAWLLTAVGTCAWPLGAQAGEVPAAPPQQAAPAAGNWKPPIGIPRPQFGIDETHHMYKGKKYEAGGFDYRDAGNGPFSHYVDNTHAQATDEDNPHGTPEKPRKSVPEQLPAGCVVEIHGGPYSSRQQPALVAKGTKECPIFVRGTSKDKRPNFSRQAQVSGSFLVIEYVAGMAIRVGEQAHHVSIRHNEQGSVAVGDCSHVVIYDNLVHNHGDRLKDQDGGTMGVVVLDNSDRIWIVDNHLHHNGDDDIHAGHGCKNIHHLYVGRNHLHHARENAIDFKAVNDVIISQNRMYSYRRNCSSGGDAMRINDEGKQSNIWILYNEIYDSHLGIAPYQCSSPPYIIGNVIYDCRTGITSGAKCIINNTLFGVDTGISLDGEPKTDRVSNNIIAMSALAGIKTAESWTKDTRIENNLLWTQGGGATPPGTIGGDPRFKNVPAYSVELRHLEFFTNRAEMTAVDENKATRLRVADVNLEQMGVRDADRVAVKHVPEVMIPTRKPTWAPGWQRVRDVKGDTLTLRRNLAKPNATARDVEMTIWYYPDTRTELYLDEGHGFQKDDTLEIDYDGVPRTVTSVAPKALADSTGKPRDRVTFSPATAERIQGAVYVANWKATKDIKRDFGLKPGSPAIDSAAADAAYEDFRKAWQEEFKALDSEDLLDISEDRAGMARPKGEGWDLGAHESEAP